MMAVSTFIITTSSGFEFEAGKEIERIMPQAKVRSMFFKGNLLVESSHEENEAIAKLREAQTLHVGRVFPVDAKAEISSSKESITKLTDQILQLEKLKPHDTFVVRCRRRGRHQFTSHDVEETLGAELEQITRAAVDLRNPRKVVNVQIFQNQAFIGVTDVESILVKPIRESRKYKKGERPFTRAEHKIREAIKAFSLSIEEDFEVLDLGAAPGGWTKVLSGLAKRVVAVDPGSLDPAVTALSNVTHIKCRAESLSEDIGQFHMVTNDMNLSPSESARIMVDVASRLRKGGIAIMTVKFVTHNRRRHVKETIKTLKPKYKDFHVKRLPHNRYEVTLYMRKI